MDIDSQVTIIPRLAAGYEVPGISVRISGEVRPDVQVAPEGGVTFGAKNIGAKASTTITIWSISQRPIEVVSIEPELPSMRVLPIDARPITGDRSYTIEHRVTTEGLQHTSLRITVCSNGQTHTLTVPVTYYGVAERRPEGVGFSRGAP